MTEELEEEFIEEEFMDDVFNEEITDLVKAAAKSANKLTALIVDNNRHNSKKMTDDDIYEIYKNSFHVAVSTIMPTIDE